MVADPTREEILAAKARAEMATKEPWGTRPGVSGSGTSVTADGTAGPAWCGVSTCSPGHSIGEDEARNNAIFIAAARTDVPALCDLALRQMEEIERLKEKLGECQLAHHAAQSYAGSLAVQRDKAARSGCKVCATDLAAARAALAFYACPDNWSEIREQDTLWDRAFIDASDEEGFPPKYDSIGGKRARHALGIAPFHRDGCGDSGVSACITQESCLHKCNCCVAIRAALRNQEGVKDG